MTFPNSTRVKKSTGKYILLTCVVFVCCIGPCASVLFPALPNIDQLHRPTWSADSQSLALECVFYTLDDIAEGFRDPDSGLDHGYHLRDICIINKTGELIRRLTYSRYMHAPAWALSGQLLAWLSGDSEIIIWDASNDDITSFVSAQSLHYSDFHGDRLVWSQDATTIFLQGSGVRLDLVEGQFQYVPEQQVDLAVCCYAWSTDGRLLAVKQDQGRDAQYHPHYRILLYEGSKLISKGDLEATYYEPSVWSPDNTVLAWVSSSVPNGLFGDQLSFTWAVDGETVTLAPRDARTIQCPTWSPNGEQLAYSSWDGIHILTLQRKISPFSYSVTAHFLLDTGGKYLDGPLSWSPDGQRIAFGSRDDDVLILDLNDGRNILEDR